MFKELQSVVCDSSAFTMCLAVYVQVCSDCSTPTTLHES
jgi:hypothetical protein